MLANIVIIIHLHTITGSIRAQGHGYAACKNGVFSTTRRVSCVPVLQAISVDYRALCPTARHFSCEACKHVLDAARAQRAGATAAPWCDRAHVGMPCLALTSLVPFMHLYMLYGGGQVKRNRRRRLG